MSPWMSRLLRAQNHCLRSIKTFLHGCMLILREFHPILLNIALKLTCNHSSYPSSKIYNEPKLCYSHLTRFGQTFECRVHYSNGGNQLVITHHYGTKNEWQVLNLHGIFMTQCYNQEASKSFTIHLKWFQTKWQVKQSIPFWTDFSITTKS